MSQDDSISSGKPHGEYKSLFLFALPHGSMVYIMILYILVYHGDDHFFMISFLSFTSTFLGIIEPYQFMQQANIE
ncbi:hypothetical protein BDA99DRAFT_493524 [Phascolomyces articulosus]|uniref:Uncharacterized protein n=1 Tax=Phascolomyces articulosus TaxID=60185 RepID=A0AAD5PJN0_9FUNG|nr:hypothetical protein BDA99DRAFT_493524 [Phascolomyces articulosus]